MTPRERLGRMEDILDGLAPEAASRICGLLGRLHWRVSHRGDDVAGAWDFVHAERLLGGDADGLRATAFVLWGELAAMPPSAQVATVETLLARVLEYNNRTEGLGVHCRRCQSRPGRAAPIGWVGEAEGGLHVEGLGRRSPPDAALRAKAVHNVRLAAASKLDYVDVVPDGSTFTLRCAVHGDISFEVDALKRKLHGLRHR